MTNAADTNIDDRTKPARKPRAPVTSVRRTMTTSDARGRVSRQEESSFEGVHPRAYRLPIAAVAWFVISMAIAFADTGQTAYLMVIVGGFTLIFFGLTVGLGLRASNSWRLLGSTATFRRFLRGRVSIYTGRISGREAMLQLTVLPVTLALGGMAIGLVYLFVR